MTDEGGAVKPASILVVRDVEKHYGGVRAVDGASFDVARGSITALIGPNGAGKSSLFNVITGFERGDRGEVELDGQPVQWLPPFMIARRGMVRTFQLTKTLSVMSVLDNMMLAAPEHPGELLARAIFSQRRWRRRERDAKLRALDLLERFQLADKASANAGTLSGGQRKLLELARAMMLEPSLLLLDEPLAGINPTLRRGLLEHIEELRRDRGTTFLFIEHDIDSVMRHADRVIVMAQGKMIADGSPEAVRSDERVIEAYLGVAAAHGEDAGTDR
jgi:neutral amino acid transport system ATP-binding protein